MRKLVRESLNERSFSRENRGYAKDNVAPEGVTVLLPGGFKPLTAGHLGLIKRYAEHPEVKEVRVLIGPGIRNGIDQKLSLKIAEELLSSFDNVSAEAVPYPSPILTAYKYITDEAEPGTYALAGSKKGGDYERVTKFAEDFSPGGKYASFLNDGVKVIELPIDAEPLIYKGRTDDNNGKPISASIMRKDILNDDYENFVTNYPRYNERIIKKIWKMLKRVVIEGAEEEYDGGLNERWFSKNKKEDSLETWFKKVLKKHHQLDNKELIETIFFRAQLKNWKKADVHYELSINGIYDPEFTKELYTRFEELKNSDF